MLFPTGVIPIILSIALRLCFDFINLSLLYAEVLSANSSTFLIFQGRYGFVDLVQPLLCSSIRLSRLPVTRSEEHTSELQSLTNLVCRLLLEKNDREQALATAQRSLLLSLNNPTILDFLVGHQTCHLGHTVNLLASPIGVSNFFFNDTVTTEIYTLSLHDALPIYFGLTSSPVRSSARTKLKRHQFHVHLDRKSTRLNSSHDQISYAVFCLEKSMFEAEIAENEADTMGTFDQVRRVLGD